MGGDKKEGSIYSEAAIAAMESLGSQEVLSHAEYPDRNIFEWYERRLPAQLPGAHLIDWGAGAGRFAPLYLRRQPKRLTLVEPSPAGYELLCDSFGGRPDVEILNAPLGTDVKRYASPPDVLHFCTFVINCLDRPSEAFRLLAQSIHAWERLIAFTNVFIPPSLAKRLRWDHVLEEMAFDLHVLNAAEARLPRSTTFTNQIIGRKPSLSIPFIPSMSTWRSCATIPIGESREPVSCRHAASAMCSAPTKTSEIWCSP